MDVTSLQLDRSVGATAPELRAVWKSVNDAAFRFEGPPSPSGAGGQRRLRDRDGSASVSEERSDDRHPNTEEIRLAVTRLVSSGPLPTRTAPFKQNPFFTVQLYLRPTSGAKLWHGNREISVDSQRHDGSVTTHNFEQEPSVYLGSSFDILQFYVPRDALDEFADENELRRCEGLVWPHGKVDPTFKSLALSIMPALEEPELSSQIYMDYLILATHSYIARNYGGMVRATKAPPGGLAHWQKQRATELLRANPDGDVSLHDISRECRLSPSRFAHAFKESFGLPPHRWLIEKRVEIAKDLLRKSELPIIDVALRSGFPDQTTFYRAFRRSASMSPSEWRRR